MKKKMIAIVCAVILFIAGLSTVILLITKKGDRENSERVNLSANFSGKVNQWSRVLGTVKRKIPTETSSEGLSSRYPTYGTSLANITDEEKDNILLESSQIMASSTTYDSIDKDGNLLLSGEPTGKKLYKHISSKNMYLGDVSDSEPAVIKEITITANEQRNYVTGLYAPAGEVVKIEISKSDLEAIGDTLKVYVGQVSHRGNINNIWKARNDFSRMPVVANILSVSETTGYVGNVLGGPIYIQPAVYGKTFSVKISGAVQYAHYIHGQTTKEEVQKMKTFSAPYYDYEVWDLGVRLSGSSKYGNYDYENLVKVGDLWEKIIRTSRQVPCSANATIGVGYVYDCFVAAGSACAFQGGHSWINAPCDWMAEALNYESMINNGFWGTIHEYNHLYQSYGMEGTKTNEVTNNATSLLSYILYTKISEKRTLEDSSLSGWNRYTDPSRSLRETISNAKTGAKQNSLNAYADLIHTFGADLFAKATRLQQSGLEVDDWYTALSLATDYNFTYYFEKLLGQTLSAEVKALYDDPQRITFVPIATTFQTGRSFYQSGKEVIGETVKPFRIESGESIEIDFNERLIIPTDFTFEIKKITMPKSGTLERIDTNKYKYTPGEEEYSGTIYVTVELASENYQTKDVTLALQFQQYHKNQVMVTKYTYGGDVKYSSVKDAVENNFAGYTEMTESKESSTFVNGLKNGQIAVVKGKMYIGATGEYAFCLRSGRGNNTLYLAVNSSNVKEVLSLNTDHKDFALEGEHIVKLNLKKGDYVFFEEITLSRHYADAYTELGCANLNTNNPQMKTIPLSSLYLFGGEKDTREFVAPEKYKREYSAGEISREFSANHTLVSSNMDSWDGTTKIENIFDGNSSTFFHNNQNNFVSESNPFVLIVDTLKTKTRNSIKIVSRTSGQYNLPVTFKLYVRGDGESWTLAGDYSNLQLSSNTVTANFKDATFRFYKLVVTDTKSQSSGNKYVTISSIELSYTFAGHEKSPYEFEFYKSKTTNFEEARTVSSFGKLIKGTGTAKYKFLGTGFGFFVRQESDAKIRVTIDGRSEIVSLSNSGKKELAFLNSVLENGEHKIEIEVLEGILFVDSIIVAE